MGIANSTGAVKSSNGQTQTIWGGFNMKIFIYVIVAIVIEFIVAMYAMRAKQYIILAIFVPLSLYIFITYGLQWFGPNGPYADTTVPWPPSINTCPDFLTAYTVSTTPSIIGCVDTIGVSRTGDFPKLGNSGVPTWSNGAPTAVIGDTATALVYNSAGFFPLVPNEKKSDICNRLDKAGLTWEGVWDGENCYGPNGSVTTGNGVTDGSCG